MRFMRLAAFSTVLLTSILSPFATAQLVDWRTGNIGLVALWLGILRNVASVGADDLPPSVFLRCNERKPLFHGYHLATGLLHSIDSECTRTHAQFLEMLASAGVDVHPKE